MKGERFWRTLAAVGVLAVLVFFGIRLLPFYVHNREFQRFLASAASDQQNLTRPEDQVCIEVAQKGTELGLPVRVDEVQLDRSAKSLRIGVKYAVQVAVPFYAMDLHFSPHAEKQF